MNVDNGPAPEIGPGVWEQREMREALARRDLTAVYRRLQRVGISQRRIAVLTGQSSSEVYEILKGRRVMAYDVLARIADGLDVPRGYLGLAYDESTETALELAAAPLSTRPSERDEVRQLLSHAANLTMAADVDDMATWWQPVDRQPTPVPARIGMSDVEQVESITGVMRALDYRYGGGACRDGVVAQVAWAQQFLAARYAEEVRHRLHLALADLRRDRGRAGELAVRTPARADPRRRVPGQPHPRPRRAGDLRLRLHQHRAAGVGPHPGRRGQDSLQLRGGHPRAAGRRLRVRRDHMGRLPSTAQAAGAPARDQRSAGTGRQPGAQEAVGAAVSELQRGG